MLELESLLAAQQRAIIDGDRSAATELAERAIASGADLRACIERGFVAGIEEVGRLWEEGEYFLPELVQSAEALKAAMALLRPELLKQGERSATAGRVVIGTVQGDIHDIGKTLVATFLEANGFEVIDLGKDVPLKDFVDIAEQEGAQIIGLSALLTTTMPGQAEVVRLCDERGLRPGVAIMVGGAPVTRRYAESIGADGFAANAVDAVSEARRLLARTKV